MDIHKNARLPPHSRAELVRRIIEEGQTPKAVATALGVCAKTARKWVARYRADGPAGLLDRSSRLHSAHGGLIPEDGRLQAAGDRLRNPDQLRRAPATTVTAEAL